MTLLQCDTVSFGYAGDTLFRDVTFSLEAGDRLGLVAPNGAGKTTLLRILGRELEPESGRVLVPSGVRVGYLRQVQALDEHATVLDALLSGYADVVRIKHDLADAEERAGSGDDAALARLARLQDAWDHAGGHALEAKVAALAGAVGFAPRDMPRAVASLSGGERGRLALGVVLASEPRVLLLDEPTNHLDLETTEKLESMIRAFHGAVVIVSHDRAFLDHTTTITGELGSRRFRVYHAPYSQYLILREDDLAREEAARKRQQEEIARTEAYIAKNLAGTRTKSAQSRRTQLAKVERLERSEDIWGDAKRVGFRFADARRSGDIVLDCKGLAATRGGRVLFRDVELLLRRGERIGIVGPNGSGKSTLLKLLAGVDAPDSPASTVRRGTNLDEAYFDQHLESLEESASAIDEIRKVRGDLVPDAVRQYLARFQITGDDPFRTVKSFSGGERTRLALAKMLLVSRNVLYLDEPTNHLDIPATEILEEALASFPGTVVLVSHDRWFLDRVTTRLLHLADGKVEIHPGNYTDWRESVARAERSEPTPSPSEMSSRKESGGKGSAGKESAGRGSAGKDTPKEEGSEAKAVYSAEKGKARERERRERRTAQLEKEIAAAEAQHLELKEKLVAAPSGAWEEIARMANEERALGAKIEKLVEEWSKLHA